MKYSFRFADDALNEKLIKLLKKKKVPHSVDTRGAIRYSSDNEERIENELIKSVRDTQFPTWQIISCPQHWSDRYQDYMKSHEIPYVIELIDGKTCFLLPRKYRPHAWKLEADDAKENQRLAVGF